MVLLEELDDFDELGLLEELLDEELLDDGVLDDELDDDVKLDESIAVEESMLDESTVDELSSIEDVLEELSSTDVVGSLVGLPLVIANWHPEMRSDINNVENRIPFFIRFYYRTI